MPTNRFSCVSAIDAAAYRKLWEDAKNGVGLIPEQSPVYWVIDPAKPDCTVEWSSVNDVTIWVPDEPAAVAAPDTSHIWDMLVLAARSSRYGD